jgi:hypothetical protein
VNAELAISIRGAVKRYGEITAVDGLDLEVPYGTSSASAHSSPSGSPRGASRSTR